MINFCKTKRSSEQPSFNRFVFFKTLIAFGLIILLSCGSCGEPKIKLTRADRKFLDTLVNHQLDSISPILDSLCEIRRDDLIQKIVDSVVLERTEREKRLRNN